MIMRLSSLQVGLAALLWLLPKSPATARCPNQDATISVEATADGGLKAPRYLLHIACSGDGGLRADIPGQSPSRSETTLHYSTEQLRALRQTIDAATFSSLPTDISGSPSPPD